MSTSTNIKQDIIILEQAVNAGQRNGSYSIEESVTIHGSLVRMKQLVEAILVSNEKTQKQKENGEGNSIGPELEPLKDKPKQSESLEKK